MTHIVLVFVTTTIIIKLRGSSRIPPACVTLVTLS